MSRNLLWMAVAVIAAGSPVGAAAATFDAPEMILDASSYLYPSPVYQDIDDDGKPELLIGDLRGYVTVYKNASDGRTHEWGEPVKLQAEGKDLKLSNW